MGRPKKQHRYRFVPTPETLFLFRRLLSHSPDNIERVHPLLETVLRFYSGIDSPTDLKPFMALGKPVGIALDRCSPGVIEGVYQHIRSGGRAFVDNGAFSAFMRRQQVDFRPIMGQYRRMARRTGRSNLSFVMPDIVGDQRGSLELQRKWRAEIRGFIEEGIDVLVPVQRGRLPPSLVCEELRQMLGTDHFRIAVPSNAVAFALHELSDLVNTARHIRGLHFLGIANRKKMLIQRLEVLRPSMPDHLISVDAAWVRTHVGRGNPITELQRLFAQAQGVPPELPCPMARQQAIAAALAIEDGLGYRHLDAIEAWRREPRKRRGASGLDESSRTILERQRSGARYTNALRVGQTTRLIRNAQRQLLQSGRKPTKSAVSRLLGMSREHISKRYAHLFGHE